MSRGGCLFTSLVGGIERKTGIADFARCGLDTGGPAGRLRNMNRRSSPAARLRRYGVPVRVTLEGGYTRCHSAGEQAGTTRRTG